MLIARPVRTYYMSTLVKAYKFDAMEFWWMFLAAAVLAVLITVLSLWAGIKRLKKMEI
ncbi:MAG: hypothetical protein BWY84_00887 [Candidatus Aerophobetes bacterium ADurb.Bin490]|nr:MAG: hypothetical protein BWY84_00887 [Candidatus Aerophobetes bacterium ADurb.Bin490]